MFFIMFAIYCINYYDIIIIIDQSVHITNK